MLIQQVQRWLMLAVMAATSTACHTEVTCRVPAQEPRAERADSTESRTPPPSVLSIEHIVRPSQDVFVAQPYDAASDQLAGARAVVPLQRYVTLPNRTIWRPRAHFGPFFFGSDLGQVQILLNDRSGQWYYNQYFTSSPDAAIYQKYYPSASWPPSNSTPEATAVGRLQAPGTLPAWCGAPAPGAICPKFNDVLMQLTGIHYTSKYGGSLRMNFVALEDNEVELRAEDALWDIKGLKLFIYVVPSSGAINAGIAAINQYTHQNGAVHAELAYESATEYSVREEGGIGQGLIDRVVPLDEAKLRGALQSLAPLLASSEGIRFAHAFFHAQHQDRIEPTNRVEAIELSDDWAEIYTRTPEPRLTFQMSVGNITAPGYLPPWLEKGEYDYHVSIGTRWAYALPDGPVTVDLPRKHVELYGEAMSTWQTLGSWAAEECGTLIGVSNEVRITEKTKVVTQNVDRPFDPINIWRYLGGNCSAVVEAVNANSAGIIQELAETMDVKEGGNAVGSVVVRYRMRLHFR